jgi:hypothetical protein
VEPKYNTVDMITATSDIYILIPKSGPREAHRKAAVLDEALNISEYSWVCKNKFMQKYFRAAYYDKVRTCFDVKDVGGEWLVEFSFRGVTKC